MPQQIKTMMRIVANGKQTLNHFMKQRTNVSMSQSLSFHPVQARLLVKQGKGTNRYRSETFKRKPSLLNMIFPSVKSCLVLEAHSALGRLCVRNNAQLSSRSMPISGIWLRASDRRESSPLRKDSSLGPRDASKDVGHS